MYKKFLEDIKQRNEKILILGAGVTGYAVAEFCLRIGVLAEIWDDISKSNFLNSSENLEKFNSLLKQGISFKFLEDQKEISTDFALAVSSPGIPLSSSLHLKCNQAKLEIISELELSLLLIREVSDCCHIVVTGSNGKSTTVSLIAHIIKSAGKSVALCGNIGKSVLDLFDQNLNLVQPLNFLVVEASSYQLESLTVYRPDIALMLNLSENHLERHKTMANYLLAKKKLIQNCRSTDTVIVPADQDWLLEFSANSSANFYFFGFDKNSHAFIDSDNSSIQIGQHEKVLQLGGCEVENYYAASAKLIGEHNLKNIAASLLACVRAGLDLKKAIKAAQSFESLEHRLELIQTKDDVLIFNDSKSTTVEATIAACEAVFSSYADRQVTLMLGGREKKDSDWKSLAHLLQKNKSRIEKIVFFGESAESIKQQLLTKGLNIPILLFNKLSLALEEIKSTLIQNSLLLFSPGCASFDEFKNFEERGKSFKARFER